MTTQTTADLLPGNIIYQVKSLQARVAALEKLLGRGTGDTPWLLREKTTGALYRLECEIINGEPSLFLAPTTGQYDDLLR